MPSNVDFTVDFDVDSPDKESAGDEDREDKSESMPPPEPELEIVPHEERKEEISQKRSLIYDILNGNVRLPWVRPSKRERGQA